MAQATAVEPTTTATEPTTPAACPEPAVAPASGHAARRWCGEEGLATAEILAIAALSVAALVVIFTALTGLGEQVVAWIQDQILAS